MNKSKHKSRCVYCGATSYGKGCKYGPKGTHFFPDDPTKCSYCGSTSYGRGCKINPFDDLHIHGPAFNQMFKENLDSTLTAALLLAALQTPIDQFPAYLHNLIDEDGNKIAEVQNKEQQLANSDFPNLILKIKKALGAKLDIIAETVSFKDNLMLSEAQSPAEIIATENIKHQTNELLATICEQIELGNTTLERAMACIRQTLREPVSNNFVCETVK